MSPATRDFPGEAKRAIETIREIDELARSSPGCEVDTSLVRRTYRLEEDGEQVGGWLSKLDAASKAGQRVTAQHSSGDLSVEWHTSHPTVINGNVDDLNPILSEEIRDLVQASDISGLFRLLDQHRFQIVIECSYASNGVLWMPSRAELERQLDTGAWASCLQQITAKSGDEHLIIVFDDEPAEMSVIETPLFTFTGLTTSGLPLLPVEDDEDRATGAERSRRRRIIREGWPPIPSPTDLLPFTGTGANPLAEKLTRVSFLAAWYWMAAESPAVTTSTVSVAYKGVRDVRLDLDPSATPTPDVVEATQLWQWSTATSDVTRHTATQQAISYAVADSSDLDQAAGAILRTAKSLHELAARDLISEALAARRSGREAAAAAAAAATAAAQRASGKAIERSLAMLAAGAAVVFATVQEVLRWYASALGLTVLAMIFIGGLRLSLVIDIRSAKATIESTKNDLDQYRDTLTSTDLKAIKNMQVLADAEGEAERARKAVWIIYSASALASLIFALLFALTQPA